MRRGVNVGVIAAGGGILIASFLPWVVVTEVAGAFAVLPTSNAWNTSVGENFFNLPNWLIPATALLTAFIHLLGAFPETRVPERLPLALSSVALAQLLWFAISISSWALPGLGAFVTLLLLLYILSQSLDWKKLFPRSQSSARERVNACP